MAQETVSYNKTLLQPLTDPFFNLVLFSY